MGLFGYFGFVRRGKEVENGLYTRFRGGGGSVKCSETSFSASQIAAGGKADFTGLKGRPKAFWVVCSVTNGNCILYTNVNPTTGAVDETGQSGIYSGRCNSGGTPTDWSPSSMTFTVDSNSLSPDSALVGVAYRQILLYTY